MYMQPWRETHARQKHHSPEQPIKMLTDVDTQLNAGLSDHGRCRIDILPQIIRVPRLVFYADSLPASTAQKLKLSTSKSP